MIQPFDPVVKPSSMYLLYNIQRHDFTYLFPYTFFAEVLYMFMSTCIMHVMMLLDSWYRRSDGTVQWAFRHNI